MSKAMEKHFKNAFGRMTRGNGLKRNDRLVNAMFDLSFGDCDETELTIEGGKLLSEVEGELFILWRDFCNENGFDPCSLDTIAYVGPDPEYSGSL